MYVHSLSRTFLICLTTLVLAACGGGGGGGSDSGIVGGGGSDGGGGAVTGSLTLTIEFGSDDTDQVLAGNERATLVAEASESGSTGELSVVFEADGGTLETPSATTSGGVARGVIIGDGEGAPIRAVARITLSDGTTIEETVTIQASSEKPSLTLVVRNSNGASVTQFDSNVELTAEATLVDFDGGPLSDEDAGQSVSFELGAFADITSGSALTEFQACPVVGIKENKDCAFVEFTSSTSAGAGSLKAVVEINGISLEQTINVENTGTSGGIPDQDSFTMVRILDGLTFSPLDTLALEGNDFSEQQASIRVDLADFQENPVPDGTEVNFRTELGDIDQTCEISSGFCEVVFTPSEPKTPVNSSVSFKNLDDDQCPSSFIMDEQVTVAGGRALTDYRADDILRVRLNGTNSFLTEGSNYTASSNGINCLTCTNGQVLQITYTRLWMDEENDADPAHVMLTPGVGTAPFLDVSATPCFAPGRSNIEEISGSIDPTASTSVAGVGTSFVTELAPGDRIKVGNEVRTVASIASNTSLVVTTAFSDTGVDSSPERLIAPDYIGGMGQPYGGRNTIIAWTQGEESFDDANGNGEYDFGETFRDLPEPFLDRNEDGVLGDQNGDSGTADTIGPYRDAGTGTDAPANSAVREKSDPYCYGPLSIVGDANDGSDSTESSRYCYQDGGENDFPIDTNGNGVLDVGNGIYNGSRCIEPVQNGVTVCTTELVDVRGEVQLLMSGSLARTSWRARGANGLGGTHGAGEIIQGIEDLAGISFEGTVPNPSAWSAITPVAVSSADSLPGFVFGGAQIDTSVLDTDADLADEEEEVSLFTISSPFASSRANYEVSFDVSNGALDAPREGALDVYSGNTLVLDDCETATCQFNLSGDQIGDLRFVSGEDAAGDFRVIATVHNFEVSGTTTGTAGEFRSTENLISNNRATSTLTEFNVGEEINSTTVFPGFSERAAPSGTIPEIYTTRRSGVFWFTDAFNGRLPENSEVKIESTGCDLVSVGGIAVNNNASSTFTVGEDVTFGLSYVVTTGTGPGAITATITTKPSNTVAAVSSISCDLVN